VWQVADLSDTGHDMLVGREQPIRNIGRIKQ